MTTNRAAECSLAHVAPALLLPPRQDLRSREGSEYRNFFDALVADLRTRGVQQPLLGYRDASRYRVLDGETRRLAALLAGVESVPVLVHDCEPSSEELIVAQLQANAMRRDVTVLETARAYQHLLAIHGWTQAELAQRLCVSAGDVSKTLAISKDLAPELQGRVAGGSLAPSVAYALTRLKDHARQIELADLAERDCLKRDAVEARVKSLVGKKPAIRPIRLRWAGGEMILTGTTPEAVQASLDAVSVALKRLAREGLPLSVLPSLLSKG